jgi:osmotically-inducible protein OsmY
MSPFQYAAASAIAFAGLLVIGCDDTADRTTVPANSPERTASSERSIQEKDADISSTIHNRIETDRYISNNGKMIDVETTNGVVVLYGTIHHEADHQEILAKSVNIPGVVRIEDRIVVQ